MDDYSAIPELPGGDYTGAFPLTQGVMRRAAPKTVAQTSIDQGGSVLPMARAASDPYDTSDLMTRRREMMEEQRKLQTEPDYSQQQQYMRDRSATYLPQALSAALLGMGPQATQPLAKLAAQQANEVFNPMKVEGGFIDPSGSLQLDPGYKRQKQLEALRDDILNNEKLIVHTHDAAARDALARENAQMRAQYMQGMLEMRRQGQQMTYELGQQRAHDARQRALDRQADKGLGAKDRYIAEDRMGDDYRGLVKEDRAGLAATQQIAALPTNRAINSTEQMALVYLLNKFLDPGSVVREGEYDRVAKAQGMIERAQMLIPKLTTGAFITPRMQQEIREMSGLYERAAGGRIGVHAQDFADRASRRGLDPSGVIGADARFIPQRAAPGAPGAAVSTPGGAAVKVPRGGNGMQYME